MVSMSVEYVLRVTAVVTCRFFSVEVETANEKKNPALYVSTFSQSNLTKYQEHYNRSTMKALQYLCLSRIIRVNR